MSRLPSLSPKKIIKILKQRGFQIDHTTGSHFIFYNPATKRRALVAYHAKELPRGTLIAILKQAGISTEDL